jgi:hypothetical protein
MPFTVSVTLRAAFLASTGIQPLCLEAVSHGLQGDNLYNTVTYTGLAWLVIMSLDLMIGFIGTSLQLQSVITVHNQSWPPRPRFILILILRLNLSLLSGSRTELYYCDLSTWIHECTAVYTRKCLAARIEDTTLNKHPLQGRSTPIRWWRERRTHRGKRNHNWLM